MDDLISGATTVEEAKELKERAIEIFEECLYRSVCYEKLAWDAELTRHSEIQVAKVGTKFT